MLMMRGPVVLAAHARHDGVVKVPQRCHFSSSLTNRWTSSGAATARSRRDWQGQGFDECYIDLLYLSQGRSCLLYRCCRSYQHRSVLEARLSLSRVFTLKHSSH